MTTDESFRSVLKRRKTTRRLTKKQLSHESFKALLWAAFGHTHSYGDIKMRTAPSAGAIYPIEISIALEDVENLADGIYAYNVCEEDVRLLESGKCLNDVRAAAWDQKFISKANVAIALIYDPSKIVPHYGDESYRYAALECGHIAQNIMLMATSLNLGTVPVGAFEAIKLGSLFKVEPPKEILYLICAGTIDQPLM